MMFKKSIVLLFTLFSLSLFGQESLKKENPSPEKLGSEETEKISSKKYEPAPIKQEEPKNGKAEDKVKELPKEEETKPNQASQESKNKEKTSVPTNGVQPLPIGNFALPLSQQIAPLVSFGQLVIGADVLQYYLLGNFFVGRDIFTSTLTPAILYGITDQAVAYLLLPYSPGNRFKNHSSCGIEDIVLQFEYAYYTCNTWWSINQATVVANISYPSGDPNKSPPTGFGAPNFFIGGTFSHVDQWWYAFFSTGAIFPTEDHQTKFGDEYLYQFGCERVLWAVKDLAVFALMVEFDGTYSKKNRIRGIIDPNSGGNLFLITPSFWFATKKWIFQGGISFPVLQDFNGNQPKFSVAGFFIIGYTA